VALESAAVVLERALAALARRYLRLELADPPSRDLAERRGEAGSSSPRAARRRMSRCLRASSIVRASRTRKRGFPSIVTHTL